MYAMMAWYRLVGSKPRVDGKSHDAYGVCTLLYCLKVPLVLPVKGVSLEWLGWSAYVLYVCTEYIKLLFFNSRVTAC